MYEQSGESKEEEMMGEEIGELEMEELVQRELKVKHNERTTERSVIFSEYDVSGRARVTTDEERVLRGH